MTWPVGICRVLIDGQQVWARIHDNWIIPFASQTIDAILNGRTEPDAERKISQSKAKFLPPLAPGCRVFCVGLNYGRHVLETGRELPKHPVLFSRTHESFVGHLSPLLRPRESDQFDYEGELALVIGKPGRRITEAEALSHIHGFTLANDATLRDWQFHTHQYLPGKNFDASGAIGPAIWPLSMLTFEEARLETRINHEIVQAAPLTDMLFPPANLVAYISQFTELRVGDVILTGTPSGVGFKQEPPRFLKPGETVRVSMAGFPPLENTVADDANHRSPQ
jgi:2-keto-4-pentenoate hydratase/2-oxohepta-3-ene-1,7-dioic acid hydratase in catechol pathway